MNLHAMVRGLINSVHSDEICTLIQSDGGDVVDGIFENSYKDGIQIRANWQPTGEPLSHEDGMSLTMQEEKVYLFSDPASPVKGVTRLPTLRTGDFLQRKDGTYWLVTDVEEDWSASGWALVRVTQQEGKPDV